MTVSSFNYKKVGEVMKYVKREMPLAVFNFVWARGEVRDAESRNIGIEEYKNIYELLAREETNFSSGFAFAKLLTVNRMIARDIIYAILNSNKRLHKCFAGKKMVIISQNGEVKPCEMLGEYFGNLRDYDYDIQKVLSNQKAKDVLKLIAKNSCSCTFENAIGNSVIHNPFFYSKLMVKMFKSKFHSIFYQICIAAFVLFGEFTPHCL
jgi:MoaA/NifB/PqqE/SkfB family radical SAM enzyme